MKFDVSRFVTCLSFISEDCLGGIFWFLFLLFLLLLFCFCQRDVWEVVRLMGTDLDSDGVWEPMDFLFSPS
jgi:hypothetical protein